MDDTTPNILLVDDEPSNLVILSEYLEEKDLIGSPICK